jgi:hypothetical protein
MSSSAHVSARDRLLTPLSLAIGTLFWALGLYLLVHLGGLPVMLGLAATALLIVAILFVSYLIAHLSFVAHLRGHGIEVTAVQLAGIHEQLEGCCRALDVEKVPRLFILNGNGVLNAFATWFLGRRYVILNSDIVDATDGNPAGVAVLHRPRTRSPVTPRQSGDRVFALAGVAPAPARRRLCACPGDDV